MENKPRKRLHGMCASDILQSKNGPKETKCCPEPSFISGDHKENMECLIGTKHAFVPLISIVDLNPDIETSLERLNHLSKGVELWFTNLFQHPSI